MPEKGFDVLLDAVRRLIADGRPAPPFRVIAVSDGAFVREYRQQVSEWGLEPYFIFAGFQPSTAGTLVELDALVVPSRREACPLVAMEAMVLGCPLIASDCIGLREVTADAPSLRCIAGDPASLASAIAQFFAGRAAIRARARAHVPSARRSFDSSDAARRLSKVFARALAPRARGSAAISTS
jgi:glycosyltransferase involved in cell wall biosynthesis